MADKKSMELASAKAVAKVKEQKNWHQSWGEGEHSAGLRYLTEDLLGEALKALGIDPTPKVQVPVLEVNGKPKLDASGKPLMHTLQSLLSRKQRDVFSVDRDWMYASNMKKLLIRMGELPSGQDYE